MVSGFEKRRLSGMLGLLSVDCAKAGGIVPAMDSVTAPATTCLREISVENSCESSEEDGSAMSALLRSARAVYREGRRTLPRPRLATTSPRQTPVRHVQMALGGMRGRQEGRGTIAQIQKPRMRKSRSFLGVSAPQRQNCDGHHSRATAASLDHQG